MDNTETRSLPDSAVGNWAFAKLVSEHLDQAIATGKFSEVQEFLKDHGYSVQIINKEKRRKRAAAVVR